MYFIWPNTEEMVIFLLWKCKKNDSKANIQAYETSNSIASY